MKRKFICLLLILAISVMPGITSIASDQDAVDVYENNLCLYETFEENTISSDLDSKKIVNSGSGNSITYADGANGSKGAARLIYNENMSSINFQLKIIPNQLYRFSAWIKLNDISLKSNKFQLLYLCKTQSGKNGYRAFEFNDAEFKTNEWVHVSGELSMTSDIWVVANPDEPVDENAVGSIGIRFGSTGEFSNIEGGSGPYDFSIDDFIVEPVVKDNSAGGNEFELDIYNWKSDFTRSRMTAADGENVVPPESVSGSSQRIRAKNSGYVGIYRDIPGLWYNRAYKIGMWARADFAEGATGGDVCIIAYNTNGNKTDSRISKWPTTSSGKTLTEDWQYYEWIYFRGLNTMGERADAKVEFRAYLNKGAGSYVYMSDMSIEPLSIPYQEAVNYGAVDKDAAIENAGWSFEDETKLEKDESFATAYRMIETSDSLKQHVQMKNNKKYRISFRAKAESYVDENGAAVNIGSDVQSVPVFAVLDRSGNTNYIGDWEENAGNSDTPSYDYQYVSGEALTENDAWSAAQATENPHWELTDEWQRFSGVYIWNYKGNNYRMPLLGFSIGDPQNPAVATWSIADVKIEEVTGSVGKVQNFNIDGDMIVGTKMSLSYDYENPEAEEGISYVRILTGSDSAGWITRDVLKASELRGYTIPEEFGGQIKVEILPIDYNGNVGILYSEILTVEKVFEITAENVKWKADSISGEVKFTENRSGVTNKEYIIVTCLYTADNTMLSTYQSVPVKISTGDKITESFSVPTDGTAAKARIFVWGGTDVFNTDMIAYTDLWEYDRT